MSASACPWNKVLRGARARVEEAWAYCGIPGLILANPGKSAGNRLDSWYGIWHTIPSFTSVTTSVPRFW